MKKSETENSQFAKNLGGESSIVSLMADLGEALNVNPDILFLGGGNPARIPEVEAAVSRQLQSIADDPGTLHKLIGVYQSPAGEEGFLELLAKELNTQMGWPISPKNIALTAGSQSAFFILINLLQKVKIDGTASSILLPLAPEYLGYANQSISGNIFTPVAAKVDIDENGDFKYRVDFSSPLLSESAIKQYSAICVSRPTNPSGNLITGDELTRLAHLAENAQVPLIIDGAYGRPFPGIEYEDVEHTWNDNCIYALSLSKFGLPGTRTGIVVAREEIIEQVVKVNTVISLANGNLGPLLAGKLLASGEMSRLCAGPIKRYYLAQRDFTVDQIRREFESIPYHMHRPEGAFFLWLWFPRLPISSNDLYERLKRRGVLVMPGEPFFFGLQQEWAHGRQCLRLSYCQSQERICEAIKIIASELRELH